MEVTTSAEFQRRIGHYQDRALVEPVMVTRNGRERVVLLSADEFGVLTTFIGNPPFSPGGLTGKLARASRVGSK